MTKPTRCVFAIPTNSLDDIPRGHGSRLSQDYLDAWTALWDPRLLLSFSAVPEWRRGDTSGLDVEQSLIVCPDVVKTKLDSPLEERIRAGGNHLVYTNCRSRNELVGELLQIVECDMLQTPLLLDDFYALGFVVFHVQVMGRKLRYSLNLDWMVLTEQITNAAKSSLAGDQEETDRWIQAAFDSISQERDRYCSQQGNLIDLVLTAESTLGEALDRQLESEHATTIYANAATLTKLSTLNPQAWQKLQGRLSDESIAIAGGFEKEPHQNYASEGVILRSLQQGRSAYENLGMKPPTTFMQFLPGLASSLPTLLRQFGYHGALISPWSGGSTPTKDHAKIRWQTHNESLALDCILGQVLDAADSESMLTISTSMAGQLDYHQVPTVVLAHWPSKVCEAFRDLLNVSRRTPALGRFVSADKYFATTAQPYWSDQFAATTFRVPLPNPGSDQNRLHRNLVAAAPLKTRAERLASADRLWDQVAGKVGDESNTSEERRYSLDRAMQLLDGTMQLSDNRDNGDNGVDLCEARLRLEFAHTSLLSSIQTKLGKTDAYVVVNNANHPRRVFLHSIPGQVLPESSDRIIASDSSNGTSQLVLDVPPFGFAKFQVRPASKAANATAMLNRPSLMQRVFGARAGVASDDWTLGNEFMEIQIDPKKGHLRSMYVTSKRGNRLSCMLSLVPSGIDAGKKVDASQFAAIDLSELKIVENSKVCGTIEARGTVSSSNGSTVTAWIRYTLWKGSRSLDIEINLSGVDAKNFHPVWRTAWASEAATIAAWQNGMRGKLCTPLQTATELIEIDDAEYKIYFATGGLSMHQRLESNRLVSSLPIEENGTSHTRISIGLDWPRPWETCQDLLDEPWVIPPANADTKQSQSGSGPSSAWLSQCNSPNIRFAFVDPGPQVQIEPKPMSDLEGELQEVTNSQAVVADEAFWFVETQGRSGTAKFQFLENVRCGWRVDFLGKEFDTLKVEDGQLLVPYKPWERSRVALCFDRKG